MASTHGDVLGSGGASSELELGTAEDERGSCTLLAATGIKRW
jgi:hypothetical protein